MPRERPRLSSRRGRSRGGARGRANPQRSSDSSSNDARSARQGRGRGRGRAHASVCDHISHPTTRFSFPCLLDTDTYYVSVKIEKCERAIPPPVAKEHRPPATAMGQQALPPAQSICQSVQPPAPVLGQRNRPETTAGAMAGPSAPAEDDAPYTDSSEPDQYGCRVVEEQPSTSVDD